MNRYYNPVQTIEGAGCTAELTGLLEGMELVRRNVLLLVWSEAVSPLYPGQQKGLPGGLPEPRQHGGSYPIWGTQAAYPRPHSGAV